MNMLDVGIKLLQSGVDGAYFVSSILSVQSMIFSISSRPNSTSLSMLCFTHTMHRPGNLATSLIMASLEHYTLDPSRLRQ